MSKGEKTDFKFFLAKNGFFAMLPIKEPNGLPYHVTNSSSYNAEIKLYRAVIDQAIHDLGSKVEEDRAEAEEWFDPKNEDFCNICELANLNPRHVYRAVRDHLDLLAKSKEPFSSVLARYKVNNIEELTKLILKEDY